MTRLSAFLIVKNEARDLPACLASLASLADEIIVVDDESTDDTAAIARSAQVKLFTRRLDGFAAQKQFALDQATGEWALSIDADERLTPELAREIQAVIQEPRSAAGYELERQMFFLGRRLRHGGVGHDWVLRLFRRTQGSYPPALVHERVEVSGVVRRLSATLAHYSYRTVDEYVTKSNHYTTLAAEELYRSGRRFHPLDHLRPLWELVQRVGLQAAWLDGRAGLVYAALSAHTAWLRAVKLWELEEPGGR